jgi:hypothetical protein
VQLAAPHAGEAPGTLQLAAFTPSHVATTQIGSLPTLEHAPLRLVPCGPPTTVTQVPLFVVVSHAWQVPVHAALQPTPSTRKFDAHSALPAHAVPFVFTHAPKWLGSLQTCPVGQLVAPDTAQPTPFTHVMPLEHDALGVQTPVPLH